MTIHYVNAGLDMGDIVLQKELTFDENVETFATTYSKLNHEICKLLKDNWNDIKLGNLKSKKQTANGSMHTMRDFLAYMNGEEMNWDEVIAGYKRKKRRC